MKYQTDSVLTYEQDGEVFVCDLDATEEPKKVWSRQSCQAKILKLLEALPTAKREADKAIFDFWQNVVKWQTKQENLSIATRYWSNYCVHEMIDTWEEIHGAPQL